MNIEDTIKQICSDFSISIDDARYYVNESVWYGFATHKDLLLVLSELLKRIGDVPFRITIHNESAHAIEIFSLDDE